MSPLLQKSTVKVCDLNSIIPFYVRETLRLAQRGQAFPLQDEKLRQRVGKVSFFFFWELAGEDCPGLTARVKIPKAPGRTRPVKLVTLVSPSLSLPPYKPRSKSGCRP